MTDHPAPTYCTCETFQRALVSTLLYPPEMNTTRCLTCGLPAQPPTPHPVSPVLTAETNSWDYVAPAALPDAVAPVARPDVAAIQAMLNRTHPELRAWIKKITAREHRAICMGLNLCDATEKLLAYLAQCEAEIARLREGR